MDAVAYIHFHLKTGGVTTVIRHQASAARAAGWRTLVLSGEAPPTSFPAPTAVIPGLGYDMDGSPSCTAEDTIRAIAEALKQRGFSRDCLLHVHNPTLAKNRRLQKVLKGLQQKGFPLLCQIHDFAEDGRPGVYFQEEYAADCHYAVLNGRDLDLLRRAGLARRGVHLLPNPVTPLPRPPRPAPASKPASESIVLYPARAIRRKNIGELLLLSHFYGAGTRTAVSLPPNSPLDRFIHDDWRAFASRCGLPVQFEAGIGADFAHLLQGCRHIVTTSINEGFGYVYLEPWTAGKSLWGRFLPDICSDFSNSGVNLDDLYRRLAVPLSWLGAERVARSFRECYSAAARHFRIPLEESRIDSVLAPLFRTGSIDFGLLDERFQKEVILKVRSEAAAAERLIEKNPFLADPGPTHLEPDFIERNNQAVLRHYAFEAYAGRLTALYRDVLQTPVRQHIDKQVLHDDFMQPERFSLLKWGEYHA